MRSPGAPTWLGHAPTGTLTPTWLGHALTGTRPGAPTWLGHALTGTLTGAARHRSTAALSRRRERGLLSGDPGGVTGPLHGAAQPPVGGGGKRPRQRAFSRGNRRTVPLPEAPGRSR